MRVLVAGASGFIGSEVSRQLVAAGHEVLTLVRREPHAMNEFRWSPADLTIDPAALEAADAVINLAGASTGRIPWTTRYKREILYSRVNGTRTLVDGIAAAQKPPTVFLSGSAVGYFGDQPGVLLDENSAKGEGFLSDVVDAWETAARMTPAGTRLVLFRTGLVVGRGGAFTPLIPLTTLGLGARFGTGRQYWPWVSLHDEAAAIVHLLTSSLDGVVTIAAPAAATAKQVTDALADALERWHPWVIPTFAVKMLGDAGEQLLLWDEHVAPTRLLADGFTFRDDTLEKAMSRLVASGAEAR